MNNPDIIIGIDGDVHKSGVAFLETATRKLEASSLTFAELIDYFMHKKTAMAANMLSDDYKPISVVIIVEAGWLNTTHWHIGKNDTKAVCAAKGNAVGRNHETGRKIVEMARDYFGFEVIEQKPLKKIWKGKDGKITHDELAYFTGITGRTNQEMRDAALLCWHHAGFPIKIKPK